MTPREKAIDLVDKFIPHAVTSDLDYEIYNAKNSKFRARICALIAVEELLSIDFYWVIPPIINPKEHIKSKEYWEQVKQEIENL